MWTRGDLNAVCAAGGLRSAAPTALTLLFSLTCLWLLLSIRPYCLLSAFLPALPSPEDYGAELLRKYHENLSEVLTDNQVLLKMISHVKSLAPGDREVSGREGGEIWLCIHTHLHFL